MDYSKVVEDSAIDVVAFDIFDTIVSRKVHPEYVKKIWAKQVVLTCDLGILAEELYGVRNAVEVMLCKENENRGYDLEFRYDDLIEEIYLDIKPKQSIESFKTVCYAEEIAAELRVLYVNPEILSLIEMLHQKKRMYCVSDFYLPKGMIKEIFSKLEILHYFEDFFISCDYLISKRSGRLYDAFLNEIKISANTIMMVGDNKVSDVVNARKLGMKGLHVADATSKHKFYHESNKKILSKKYIARVFDDVKRNTSEPFENIIFSLFSFTQSLYETLKRKGCKNIFFLSREGQYLMKLFEAYQDASCFRDEARINTYYLVVSRKSTFLPSLVTLDKEEFDVLFRQYRKISAFDFLSSLNFNEEDIKKISRLVNADINTKSNDFPTDEVFQELMHLEVFHEIYETTRTEQRENFTGYLDSFGVDYHTEGLWLVDVGWKGSIQDNIYKILEKEDVEVKGFYLGLVTEGCASEKNSKQGILFDGTLPRRSEGYHIYSANCSIFEMLLMADHGSALQYCLVDGTPKPSTHNEALELEFFKQTIEPVQRRMYDDFLFLCESVCMTIYGYEDYKDIVKKSHSNMMLFPTSKEIETFRAMYHYENFGIFEYSRFNDVDISLIKKVSNLIRFLLNPKLFLQKGVWAPITLSNAGLSFLMKPYGLYKLRKEKSRL